MNIKEIKDKLKKYKKENIVFNEPHFTQQLMLRDGNRNEVINCLLNPEKLVYVYQERGRYGDTIYCMHFKISNTRTMRLPTIFNKKILYIITYIMRYRPWQNMVRKRK